MRVLLGIILGAVLTVGAAYLYDANNTATAQNPQASAQKPLVNWDIVASKWNRLTARAHAEWVRLAG